MANKNNPNINLYLESPRLFLRSFTLNDAPILAAYRSDPVVSRYQSWDTPYSLEKALRFIADLQHIEPGTPGEWYQVALETKENKWIIGDCAFCLLRDDSRQAEIGFSLAKQYQGQGYGVEAVDRLLEYLFLDLWVHRARAYCLVDNLASIRLLERIGMRREGLLRQSYWHHDHWVDEYAYAILREEWLDRHSNNQAPG